MKWRVMEFEDKEFLWLHLIWNLTPKIYSGSVAHPPCLIPSPSFSRATRQEPLTVPCGPNKQSHRIFSGRWSITFIFLSLRQLPPHNDNWYLTACKLPKLPSKKNPRSEDENRQKLRVGSRNWTGGQHIHHCSIPPSRSEFPTRKMF